MNKRLLPFALRSHPMTQLAQVEAITVDAKAIEDYLWTRDYVDIMREFEVKYTPEEFLELADRLKPRLYSIASSHDAHPGFVELTVGIVRFGIQRTCPRWVVHAVHGR